MVLKYEHSDSVPTLMFPHCHFFFQRPVENPASVPVSKQAASHGDAHPEHHGRGACVCVCVFRNGCPCRCELDPVVDEHVITVSQLWALLHFIMPTLFDSHEEFNEWFSKDIESHAENKSAIDESERDLRFFILPVSFPALWLNFLFTVGRLCFRPTLQAAHDPEAFHAAPHQEGRGERALGQGRGGGGGWEPLALRERSRFRLQHFVVHHARRSVCHPLPRCRTEPRNRPVSDAGVGRLS